MLSLHSSCNTHLTECFLMKFNYATCWSLRGSIRNSTLWFSCSQCQHFSSSSLTLVSLSCFESWFLLRIMDSVIAPPLLTNASLQTVECLFPCLFPMLNPTYSMRFPSQGRDSLTPKTINPYWHTNRSPHSLYLGWDSTPCSITTKRIFFTNLSYKYLIIWTKSQGS